MPNLDNRIPPPLIAASAALLIWLLSFLPGHFPLPYGLRIALMIVLFAMGILLGIGGVIAFKRAQTTVNPLKPETASTLVVGGVYQYSRNPMYTGLALWLVAWALYLDSVIALAGVAVFVGYMTRFQIKPEERAMQALFGAQFELYKARVRRWL
ncbi:MAG: methyltransferase family protein [Plesiomonas shigelloides]|uniref:methyltransferase family protein n=1 Tax=Plesiomonas shigelloides TaxID=703 RepID=UPI000D8E3490|nr:isoprenylcysteine carboxylmethyltransferase family protein [Plesiomonas shigelloides]SPZ37460.1 Putative protein-S-isoprenylcysteine methyltransferase [Plesiomonas shigelloides]